MRLEKFSLRNFEGAVVEDVLRRPYVPPSLVPEPEQETPPEPPPPTFSEADMKQSEQEGYRRGFLEGSKEGRLQAESEQAEVDRKLTAEIEQLSGHLNGLIAEYNQFVNARRAELPLLALAIARKVAGKALAENPLPQVESIVLACLERLLSEPHITVTVGKNVSDALEGRLTAHFSGNSEPGEISIQGDESMQPGDCRIEWQNGKAERDTDAMWEQIGAMIHRMIESGAPPAEPTAAAAPAAEESPQPPPNEGTDL